MHAIEILGKSHLRTGSSCRLFEQVPWKRHQNIETGVVYGRRQEILRNAPRNFTGKSQDFPGRRTPAVWRDRLCQQGLVRLGERASADGRIQDRGPTSQGCSAPGKTEDQGAPPRSHGRFHHTSAQGRTEEISPQARSASGEHPRAVLEMEAVLGDSDQDRRIYRGLLSMGRWPHRRIAPYWHSGGYRNRNMVATADVESVPSRSPSK